MSLLWIKKPQKQQIREMLIHKNVIIYFENIKYCKNKWKK